MFHANLRANAAALCVPEVAERVRREPPEVDLERLRELPGLVETVAFAARRATEVARRPGLRGAIARGHQVRRILVSQLAVLVEVGLVERRAFEPLRKGKGLFALANGLTDAVALLSANAPRLEGKLAIAPELLGEAREFAIESVTKGLPK